MPVPDERTTTETTRSVETPANNATTTRTTQSVAHDASGRLLAERVVYYILGVIEVLLAFRFVLALLGANRSNGFADFIFSLSRPFAQPFFTLFGYQPAYGHSYFEIGTLVAMAVYAVVAWGIVSLLRLPRRNATA
jgi:hypothetical protein